MVSLHAIAGIRTEDTMLVPVYIHGHRLTAVLNSGWTHNFVHVDLMRHLGLVTSTTKTHVTVANGDRVPCGVVARNIACNSWISVIDLSFRYLYSHDLYSVVLDIYLIIRLYSYSIPSMIRRVNLVPQHGSNIQMFALV